MPTKPYNGHHCWNCWNVSLWIGNDEGLYNLALECKRERKTLSTAAQRFMVFVENQQTPDGAKYTLKAVRNALEGLE